MLLDPRADGAQQRGQLRSVLNLSACLAIRIVIDRPFPCMFDCRSTLVVAYCLWCLCGAASCFSCSFFADFRGILGTRIGQNRHDKVCWSGTEDERPSHLTRMIDSVNPLPLEHRPTLSPSAGGIVPASSVVGEPCLAGASGGGPRVRKC